jgi:hypothetical protein
MTEFTTLGRQDLFETELSGSIDNSTVTVVVATAPSFTLSSGSYYAVIDPTGTPEIVEVTAVSTTTWTVTRGVALYEGAGSSAAPHAGGVPVIISNNWKTFDDIKTAIASKADVAGDTFAGLIQFSGTTHGGLRLINLTTAQRNALTPAEGMKVLDTDESLEYTYKGGAWADVDTGTTTPNMSETVLGSGEVATTAEVDAGTTTGSVGRLVVPCDNPDITKLAAVTSSAAELNILTGATADATELNQLAGTTNIAEADTFFGATDLSGAEAETLSDGSDATALHSHPIFAGTGTTTAQSATGNEDITITPGFTAGIIRLEFGHVAIPGTTDLGVYGYMMWDGTTFKYRNMPSINGSGGTGSVDFQDQILTGTNGQFSSSDTPDGWDLTISIQNVTSTTFDVRFAWTKNSNPSNTPIFTFGATAHPA